MKHALVFAGIVVAAACNLAVMPVPVQADNFSIGINVGAPQPPPAIVVPAPPPLVLVPGIPVSYAPSLDINFFAYGGRYYTYNSGAWFVATTYNGPWNFIAVEHVPRPVLSVPAAYYKVPPGHLKRGGGPPPWAGHGKGHRHRRIDD